MAWAQSIVSVNYVDENGVTQPVNATLLDEIANVNPNGATIGTSGFTNWYVVQGSDVVMNGQLGYYGGINLILCDGAKLTINNTDGNVLQSLDDTDTKYTLTIYVQTNGTGQLVATASGNKAIQTENLTIHGGTITATGGANGIYAPSSDIVINGGTVTVSSPLNSQFSTLTLIDNLTGANVDLLQTPSYTFESRTTDYASRFKLVFSAGNASDNSDDFAFISNGEIIVNGEGTLQVIDMLGHVLVTCDAHSDFRLPTSDFPAGVYVLRLINGNDVKTQKIVVE